MRIALAQLNPTVGDLSGNCELIREAVSQAVAAGADLVVTPELAVSGYPPKDLLLRRGFVAACDAAVQQLAGDVSPEIGLIVGHPTALSEEGVLAANAASLLHGGRIVQTVHKTLLPNYDVFDERRYFCPSATVQTVEFGGRRLGIHICEDAWYGQPDTFYHRDPCAQPDPVAALAEAGADLLINLSASPFEVSKPERRLGILKPHVDRHGLPLVFVNQVGGNDDLVFDGHSMVFAADGRLAAQLRGFETDFSIVDMDALAGPAERTPVVRQQLIFDALVLGLGDYMQKCGFTDCVLGLSGGIDSALACYIAARATEPSRVHAVLMPSRYSSDHSVSDAVQLAEALGIDYETIPINAVHQAYEQLPVLNDDLSGQPAGLADQNLQARIRGATVMTRSNRYGWLALATGNKSELAVGYCTLYGDMCGGFAVLSDVLKRDVYAVSRYINEVIEGREVIPQSIIDKAPSAELAPNQVDQDSLPPYPLLDEILEGLIEREESVATLSKCFPEDVVLWVARALDRNEFKRRQMAPGIKLSQRAFGSGRRMPMAARIQYER
ncbi:Glutamine-dependent NAD(+) synthetase [Maioricimonas rarisocia]|uniref:Glutamine-dependent NAD(+) synthetase n=1 Tax=Maioricimonas rarisocia TaxID=2528026 RepID=A0A517ZBS1_9PLAN|nr:NAD+ synthase [Maioricimonas rarisocia]QDU39907.1 Glutamine-dependent NAD(+) synthetase [Maioricimonas rarisocia]